MLEKMNRLTKQKILEFAQKSNLPQPFILRPAEAGDIPDILDLGRAAFDYNPPTRREISYFINKAHGACWVVCDGPLVVGYILLEAHAGRKSLYLNTIALTSDVRGLGLGKGIYSALDIIGMDLGARGLYSHVRHDNEANIHVLEKCGFSLIRREDNYYDDGASGLLYKKNYTGAL